MSQEIKTQMTLMPPEIKFNAGSGTFSGTATPGKSIRLTSSVDQQMRSTMSAADGSWTINLGGTPRLYTIFEIWACDQETGICSPKIQFNTGCSQSRISDVYASETVAFGMVKGGSKVSVYGPDGALLGRDVVFGDRGAWTVKFNTPLKAGDRLCIIANRLTGATSLPVFTTAETFSVDDRNVAHIAGSGAEPGEKIQLFNRSTMELLAETRATDGGTWSVSFCKLLEQGTPILVRRILPTGATAEGPIFGTVTTSELLPVIQYCGDMDVAGFAADGLAVTVKHYRDGHLYGSRVVLSDSSYNWSSGRRFLAFVDGDMLVATTQSADDTGTSPFYSAVTIAAPRPASPEILSIGQGGASGTGEAGCTVVISTEELGVIDTQLVSENNSWTSYWEPKAGLLPTSTLVYFVQFEALQSGSYAPSSLYTARYANVYGTQPPAPVIEGQKSDDAFYGTETDTNTTVQVFNSKDDMAIAELPATVQPDETWALGPDNPPLPGDLVYAQATEIGADGPGATSEKSPLYTVQPVSSPVRPCPPQIGNTNTLLVWGNDVQAGTWVTLTVAVPNQKPISFTPVQTDQYGTWEVDISTIFTEVPPFGTKFTATATFGPNGAETSDPFVRIQDEQVPDWPDITTVGTTAVSGTTTTGERHLQGWRRSDGLLIVDLSLGEDETKFTATYLNGATLEPGDYLWLVSAYPEDGAMSFYNRKAEGYIEPAKTE